MREEKEMAVTLQMDSAIFLFWLQKYEHLKRTPSKI